MSKVSLNLGEIAQKNAIRSKLLADSDAWLAGVRDMIATMPEPTSNKLQSKPLNLAMGKKVGRPKRVGKSKRKIEQEERAAKKEPDYQMKLLGLARLWDAGANSREMAEFMGVERNSVSKLIKKCREYGFIRSDRRQQLGNRDMAENRAQAVAKAIEMRNSGMSRIRIADELGVAISTVIDYLRTASKMAVEA